MEGYKQNSDLIDGKTWLPSYYNSRQSHLDAGAEYGFDNPIGVNESFSVGGYDCDCPGDSSLPAGEVVNCACCMAPVVNIKSNENNSENSDANTGNDGTICNKIDKELRESGVNEQIGKSMDPFDLEITDIDKHAAKRMEKRGVTKEDAQSYIDTAIVAFEQVKNEKYAFYSEEGATVATKDGLFITVIPKKNYDDNAKKIIEVVKKYNGN